MRQQTDNDTKIIGKNPVLEAFRAGKTVDRLYIIEKITDAALQTILREAKKAGVQVKFVKRERLDELAGATTHQGVIAQLSAVRYATLDELFQRAEEKGEPPFLLLLDDITDPHNFGAIIRSANLAGIHGIIIPKDGACPLNATVAKTSAGAVNYTPVAKVVNLTRTIEELKKRGVWTAAAVMDKTPIYDADLTGALAIVIGSEGKGVSRLVREHCDMELSIPMYGDIDSLNASVAAGVLAFEAARQRRKG